MRVAVVGAGLSGLAAAHELARSGGAARVTVYEKEGHLGGDGNRTMAVDDDGAGGGRVLVDLGCMFFNQMTSPNMLKWFNGLGVEVEPTDMSFSASTRLDRGEGFEWGSRNGISGVLVQKSNLLSPRFWLVIREIFNFKNHALEYLEDHGRNPDQHETLGQFIKSHKYSQLFQDAYLIPMCACIWSSPPQGVLGFPALSVLSFFRDNRLLEVFGRPQWLTVKGGPGSYVNKVREELKSMGCQIKTSCEVSSVSKFNEGYRILGVDGSEEMYDRIIFGLHAPDALKVLGDEATHDELRILGAFQYIYSDVYFHSDESLMPHNYSAWSARNFLGTTTSGACVTYWLNILQDIESSRPFLVTFNPPRAPNHVFLKWHMSRPIPSIAAAKASLELNKIQGKRGIWFCGPYQGYGFHEDSVKAKVEPEHYVLDIGSGWGTLAIRLVKKTGCKYLGITLSEEQLKYSNKKVKEEGLEDRITFLLCDYRQIPSCQKFDRIISCEMVEHVGHEYMDDFFRSCEYHLADHGLFVLQFITIPEELYDKMRRRPEFIKEYIFPGGCLPAMSRVVSAMTNSSRLCIQHLENIGDHYYTTLMHWRNNFLANREKVSAMGFDETFIRTWEYYLTYCAAMFKSRTIMDYQIVFSRPGDSKVPSYLAIE